MTSGENYEPFDELENVGFNEEPDITLLFETNGHFYVHENCAAWSSGVRPLKPKEEPKEDNEKTPEKQKMKNTNDAAAAATLIGVDKAVSASVRQKCTYCKHFGASVKCKASGRMYHFPCAAASGSFMHKPTLTLVGTESLSKVGDYGKTKNFKKVQKSPEKVQKSQKSPKKSRKVQKSPEKSRKVHK